jgi:hypothetical protein
MISHYGLFWSERDVFWGRPQSPGELRGRVRPLLDRRGAPTKTQRLATKDYRNFVGLYCLYGDQQLLYIGEAGLGTKSTLFSRLKQHRTGPLSGRWDTFSWFGRESVKGQASVAQSIGQLEAIAIAIINPGLNKQSGTFGGAKQVFQVPHERAEGNLETKLARIADQLSRIEKAG